MTPWQLPTLETHGRHPTEHEEQKDFVRWFRRTYQGVRIFAIPNGGIRGGAAGARLQGEGVSRGVPDLFVPEWLLWMEFKRLKGGAMRKEQEDWREYLLSIGHHHMRASGSEHGQLQVTLWRRSLEVGNGAA